MRNTTRLKKPQIPELDTLYRFDDLGGRPKYGGVEMTSATNIPSFDDIRDETHSMVLAEANIRHDADLAMQTEIDAIVASSDVKDIVGTKAELDAYDTSTLGDNDIIKVLQDETQDDQTTYYRWSTTTETFSLIGGEGPYYTKAATDILLNEKADKATTYTKTEVDSIVEGAARTWVGDETTASSSGTTATVATETGDFTWGEGHTVVVNFKHKADRVYLDIDSTGAYEIDNVRSLRGFLDSSVAIEYVCVTINGHRMYRPIGRLRASSTVAGPVLLADDLTTTAALYALSAKQGKVLKEMIEGLVIPTVVQSTGTSTTSVMSQDATTKMVYNDTNRREIKITGDGSSTASKIAIGSSNIDGSHGIAIGWGGGAGSSSTHQGCISIGYGAYPNGPKAYGNNSVAIGAGSYTNAQGVFAIGGNSGFTGGYNNSAYRLLTGVYDGQSAHDAVTKGQLDSVVIQNAGAPTTATAGTVGMILEDTTNGKLYICTAVNTTDPQNPSYTWTEVGSGGGGEFSREITENDFNYPANNPTSVAVWLLDPGVYHVRKTSTFVVRVDASDSSVGIDIDVLVFPRLTTGTNTELTPLVYKNTSSDEWQFDYVYTATGNPGLKSKFIMGKGISNNLTVSTSGYVLDARQGKALKDMIDGLVVSRAGAPTSSDAGVLGQLWTDTTNMHTYQCTAISGSTYTWTQRW